MRHGGSRSSEVGRLCIPVTSLHFAQLSRTCRSSRVDQWQNQKAQEAAVASCNITNLAANTHLFADESTRLIHRAVVSILIIISFFTFLWVAGYISKKVIRAGIIGPIAVGIIYGEPLANILHHNWQETFLYLGYIGLILIIFEGGLTTRLDLLRANFTLSICAAATGVVLPISLSYLLLYLGFGYGAVETFIVGASLSATSLGTTFAVISGASQSVDLSQTRVGAVLVSAAVIDDVAGLVMSSVIHDLGSLEGGSANLGWLIGRPILASALMAILTPVLSKWVLAPIFRKFIEPAFHKFDHIFNIIFMILILSAFISIAAYAGTSVLFGAFLAGSFLTYLPSKHPEGPFVVLSREEGEREKDKSPTFVHTFEYYCLDFQVYLLEPLFFASIGFAIPFLDLWTGKAIWRGIVYTLLMLVAKFLVGIWIPIWSFVKPPSNSDSDKTNLGDGKSVESKRMTQTKASWAPGLLLGMAMVARGEIGLLIVEIGYNNTQYVSEDGFVTAVWAILLNTILGPIAVGLMVKFKADEIAKGSWGLVSSPGDQRESTSEMEEAVSPGQRNDT